MYNKLTLTFFQTFRNNQTIWLQPPNENNKRSVKFSDECCSNLKSRINKSNCNPCNSSLGSYSFLFIPFSFFFLCIYLSCSFLFLCISSSFSFYFCLFLCLSSTIFICLSSTIFLCLSYTIFPFFFSLFCVFVFVIIAIIIVIIIIIIIFFCYDTVIFFLCFIPFNFSSAISSYFCIFPFCFVFLSFYFFEIF